MKILFIANTDRHIKLCHIPYLKLFKDNGYIVHVATNSSNDIEYCDKKIGLGLARHPFSFKNIMALIKLSKIVKNECYDIISCHTPVGGALGRISVIGRKNKPKVFYTAHGFHFFRGSKRITWLLYYPVERFLSRYSTCIMTMNNEDYNLAKSKFHCPVYKINGIGYDDKRLMINNEINLKKEYKLDGYYVATYIAEISKRKNQVNLINELNKYDLEKLKIKVLLVGDSLINDFKDKINNKNIIYIDFRDNVGDYISISDVIISSSIQEGLPLSILEGMHFNKKIIALNIRGNNDLLLNYPNGILVGDVGELVIKLLKKEKSKTIKYDISIYRIDNVLKKICGIYNQYLNCKIVIFNDW